MKKRLYSLCLLLVMLISLLPWNVAFAETVASGTCGDNATWVLDSEGTLTISGSGEMNALLGNGTGTIPWYSYKDNIENVIINEGITDIGRWAFYYCTNLETVLLPSTLVNIRTSAFYNCRMLKDLSLPESLTKIDDGAFNYCVSLSKMILPESVVSIGSSLKSSGISEIYIPAKVNDLSELGSCYNLKKIILNPNNENYSLVDGVLFNKNMSTLICFPASRELDKYTIPSMVTSIANYAFANNVNLCKISIPTNMNNIGYYSFEGTKKLTRLYYGGSKENWESINGVQNLNSTFEIITDCDSATIESFNLSSNEINIDVDDRALLVVNISPVECELKQVRWTSDNENIVKVDSFGCITGISKGSAIIIAEDETGAYMDACIVTVNNPIHVSNIELNKNTINLVEGETEILTATVIPGNAKNKNILWSSSDESVVTVVDGKVTAISEGEATITVMAEDGNIKETCVINVEKYIPLTGINFESNKLTIDSGTDTMINVLYIPANATYKGLTWTSSKPTVATVDNGKIHALSAGTTIVVATAADGEYKATCIVKVVQPVNVTKISLNETEKELIVGSSFELEETITPSDATNKNVIWSSENDSIAKVENGVVTGNSIGKTTITATTEDGNYRASCVVTVLPIPVTGITLSHETADIVLGNTETIEATVLPENAENKNVTWASSNTDVAEVDNNGNITAKSIGSAEISATTEIGGYTAVCNVTVIPINVIGINLDKAEISVVEGLSVSVIAAVSPENATDKTVIWSSSDENVATVENGVITGVSQGTAVIVAKTKDGGYTAYCAVTVAAAKVPVKSISLNQSTLTIVEGFSDTLTASIKPENATNQNILWSTNNEKVATVENGLVKGIAPGAVVIIATTEDGGQIATCIVNVVSAMQDSVSAPIASVLSGAVQEGTNILLLSATHGAEIYYTTDGSTPTKESMLYSQPIKINEATKIKAVAVKDGMIDSDISSFSYTIADPNVPYVSVQTNLIGNKGDTTTVSVNISENSGAAGGSFNLVYDNTAVELLSVENGTYISKANPILNDSYATNKIRTVWAGSKALAGGGEILTAQFRILDDTDKDAAYFNLEKLKLADDNAVKMNYLQSDGVLALMKAESTIADKEFVTESTLNEDNKTISVTVTSSGDNIGKMYAAVYDDNNKLIQLKCMDVKNNITPYNIVFDREVQSGQLIKIFVWDNAMRPLSDVELLQK